jgi:hypothetical protein
MMTWALSLVPIMAMYIICSVCAGRSAAVYSICCGLGAWSGHVRATRVAFCAASGVLLLVVYVAHFYVSVAAKAPPKPAGASVAACSELSERRDRLHAEIERLHAETAMIEAELGALCTMQRNQTDVDMRLLARRRGEGTQAYAAAGFVGGTVSLRSLHRPRLLWMVGAAEERHIERVMQVPTDESQQTHLGGTAPSFALAGLAEEAAGTEQIPKIVRRVDHAPPARRTGGNPLVYAEHCWAPSNALANPSCKCLGQAMHPKLASRPTIKIIVGSWYRARLFTAAGSTCTSE